MKRFKVKHIIEKSINSMLKSGKMEFCATEILLRTSRRILKLELRIENGLPDEHPGRVK